MKINKTLGLLVAVSAVYVASTGSSWAQPSPAFTVSPGQPNYTAGSANQPVNLGFVFTANATIGVDYLGFYAYPGLATGDTEEVAIFNDTAGGSLVTSASVPVGGTESGSYWWTHISPAILHAGTQYTVVDFVGNNPWASGATIGIGSSAISPSYLPGDTTSVLYGYSSSLQNPTSQNLPYNTPYYGPNFDVDAVPDGGLTVILLGMGLAGLGCLRRRLA